MSETAKIVLPAALGVLGGAAAALFTPWGKFVVDRWQQGWELRRTYSPPLLNAAFDLQSRLYNIVRLGFLRAHGDERSRVAVALRRGSGTRWQYAENSTLWLIGQYLAWVEILRHDAQFLKVGRVGRSSGLRKALQTVTHELASDADRAPLLIPRTTQRALGALMTVPLEGDRAIGRSASLGYAEFVGRLRDPEFAAWFSPLRTDVQALAEGASTVRLVRVQRALVDLVDALDEDRTVYPDRDQRGRLPRPPVDRREDSGRDARIARFRVLPRDYGHSGPWGPLQAWAGELGCKEQPLPDGGREFSRYRPFAGWLIVTAWYDGETMALHASLRAARPLRSLRHSRSTYGRRSLLAHRRARQDLNKLLARYDRPRLTGRDHA